MRAENIIKFKEQILELEEFIECERSPFDKEQLKTPYKLYDKIYISNKGRYANCPECKNLILKDDLKLIWADKKLLCPKCNFNLYYILFGEDNNEN